MAWENKSVIFVNRLHFFVTWLPKVWQNECLVCLSLVVSISCTWHNYSQQFGIPKGTKNYTKHPIFQYSWVTKPSLQAFTSQVLSLQLCFIVVWVCTWDMLTRRKLWKTTPHSEHEITVLWSYETSVFFPLCFVNTKMAWEVLHGLQRILGLNLNKDKLSWLNTKLFVLLVDMQLFRSRAVSNRSYLQRKLWPF